MTSVIAHSLTSLGAPYVVRQAAACVAEQPEATARAIEAAVPALIEALAVAVREPRVLEALYVLATDRVNDGVLLENVAAAFTMQNAERPMMRIGGALIDLVFGDDLPLVVRAVADRSGIRLASAESILRSIAPLVLSAIGKQMRAAPGQGETELARLLANGSSGVVTASAGLQLVPANDAEVALVAMAPAVAAGGGRVKIADRIKLIVLKDPPPRPVWSAPVAVAAPVVTITPAKAVAAPAVAPPPAPVPAPAVLPAAPVNARPVAVPPAPVPPAVTPAVVPGPLPKVATSAAPASAAAAAPKPKDPKLGPKEPRRGAVWPLVVGGLGALLLVVGVPLLSWLMRQDAEPVRQQTVSQRTSARGYETPRAGVRLAVELPEGSMERRLAAYIESEKPLSPTDWFELDRINFQTGSHTLTAASAEQIRNVAEVLKAYPTVRLKVGGYTDNAGDPGKNADLSTARANTVMYALVEQGISPLRLTAEGYGDQHPIADNASAEGRARNRRIALRVLQR